MSRAHGTITIRPLVAAEAFRLREIDRSEVIDRVWHRREGRLVLEDEHYDMKGFNPGALEEIIPRQEALVSGGGSLLGALDSGRLVGAVSVENLPRGSRGDYRKMDILYVSRVYRGCGLGRRLVAEAAAVARALGGAKLYISATPSERSVAFYRGLGAVEAEEVDAALFELEPEDIHLELAIGEPS
jgi:GNAT superfamily N-acetyltransferase